MSQGPESYRIGGIGEILWDLLPEGRQLGGAPANFAFHAKSLGANATVLSRVGTDPLGVEILADVRARGIATGLLQRDPEHDTGSVSVTVDAQGKPSYVIHEDVAWDFIETSSDALEFARGADAVCFGTLAQRAERSRKTIRELVAATPPDCLRIFDVNLRQKFYSREILENSLAFASVLKLSDEELPVISDFVGIDGNDGERLRELGDRFSLKLVALTRGSGGALLWSAGELAEHAGFPARVRDTVGAGDSFTATLALGLLCDHSLERINEQANRVAAWVCSRDGAAPPLPEEYQGWFASGTP